VRVSRSRKDSKSVRKSFWRAWTACVTVVRCRCWGRVDWGRRRLRRCPALRVHPRARTTRVAAANGRKRVK
jgi:hypothetical protein